MDSEPWIGLFLKDKDEQIQWICWPPLFRALEMIWLKLTEPGLFELSRLEQAAEMRELMHKELISRFEKAGMGAVFGDSSGYYGEEYLDVWLTGMKEFLG